MPELSTIVDRTIVGFGMQFFSSATIMLDQRDNSSFLGGSLLSSSSFLVSFKAVEAWDVGSLNPSSVAAASKAIMMAFSIEQEKEWLKYFDAANSSLTYYGTIRALWFHSQPR